jgi:S1-C subfamily serine protease
MQLSHRGRWWIAPLAFLAGGALVASGVVIGRTTADDVPQANGEIVGTEVAAEATTTPIVEASSEPIADVAAAVAPAVVQIETGSGLGSGFVYDAQGLIMTNAHVVGSDRSVQVRMADGTLLSGTVVGSYDVADVAVVSIDPSQIDTLTVAELALDDPPRAGETAVAIGSPFGLEQTVTAGIVSRVNSELRTVGDGYLGMIQSDTPVNSGNSGGPLVGLDGKVMGINTAIFSESGGNDGVSFAVPIDTAKAVADQLVAGESVELGFLGVSMEAPAGGDAGALITDVVTGSAAERSGVQVGDRIIEVDGRPIRDPNELATEIGGRAAGDEVVLTVARDDQRTELSVMLDGATR